MKSRSSFLPQTTAILAVAAMMLGGCSASEPAAQKATAPAAENSKIKIVTTFYPMYEFTRQVAGEHADVTALVPAGAEPHDWEPTAQDMKQMEEANVFVYNGAGVEHWVDKALQSVKKDHLTVVEASKGIDLMEGAEEEDHDHETEAHSSEKAWDPHVWLDPVLAQKEVASIELALEQADPVHKEDYKKNADAYIVKLKELDQSFRAALSTVKRKEFVTQHAAFGYLAKQYGLTQVPIAGLSPEEEPQPAKMADIIRFAKEHEVKTIFFETLADPKVAAVVAKEVGAKSAVLNPIEGLTDEDKSQNLDYIGLMQNNVKALQTALNE
ncbi:metal ABC transporter substrate-binding protein [Paenibacillus sp. SI8]|uniref:metal ABC transporter substrate-binding protein n=1 Tax=unclassified Paenibacillus TaxID=185978 RepID=UPI003467B217